MKFKSIQVDAYWFAEGDFWNVGVYGYVDDDAEPTPLDSQTLSNDHNREDVLEQLDLIADLYKSNTMPNTKCERVTILFEGSEVKTLQVETCCE